MQNGRWIKSRKRVDFPMEEFDPKLYSGITRLTSHSLTAESQPPGSSGELPSGDDLAPETQTRVENPTLDSHEPIPESRGRAWTLKDLDPHSKFYQDPNSPRVYDLYAMACHLGVMGGGHYVAYGKSKDDTWHLFNDSIVTPVTAEEVAKENGYLLFYQSRGLDLSAFLPKDAPGAAGSEHDSESDELEDGDREREMPCVIS